MGLAEAINKVQKDLQEHGEKFNLTKILVISDGLSYDIEEENFYNSISRTVKSIGFSCHFLLTGKGQMNKDNLYGYVLDEEP